MALNKPFLPEVFFYDESLAKKGEIKTTQVEDKVNYVKSMSEVVSTKAFIILGA